MRIVLDTNILISALITQGTPPDQLFQAWREERFDLVTSEAQLDELLQVIHRPKLQPYLSFSDAWHMVLDIYDIAEIVWQQLPDVTLSPDPDDNRILATAIAGNADLLITGDKSDLLRLEKVQDIPVLTPRQALPLLPMHA